MTFPTMRLSAEKTIECPYPKELKKIGDHIKKKRLDLGLYIKDAAKLIGASENTVNDWELRDRAIRAKAFPKIIAFLGYIPFEVGGSPAEQLLAYRRIRGLTHQELAEEWKIERGCLERWEKGMMPRKLKYRELLDGIADTLIKELSIPLSPDS